MGRASEIVKKGAYQTRYNREENRADGVEMTKMFVVVFPCISR